MFNVAQLVARCDFLSLKQATCCVDKLLILSRHMSGRNFVLISHVGILSVICLEMIYREAYVCLRVDSQAV